MMRLKLAPSKPAEPNSMAAALRIASRRSSGRRSNRGRGTSYSLVRPLGWTRWFKRAPAPPRGSTPPKGDSRNEESPRRARALSWVGTLRRSEALDDGDVGLAAAFAHRLESPAAA